MSFKEMMKELWSEQHEVPFTRGPWWAAFDGVLYAVLVGVNLFGAGVNVGQGENPTVNLVFAGIILVLGILTSYLIWSGAYNQGQTKVYKEQIEHDKRLVRVLRGEQDFDFDTEPDGFTR